MNWVLVDPLGHAGKLKRCGWSSSIWSVCPDALNANLYSFGMGVFVVDEDNTDVASN